MHRTAQELARSHAACPHGIVRSPGNEAFWAPCSHRAVLEVLAGRVGADSPEKRLIMKDLRSTELPRLMTTAEVASVLRVDRSTLSRWRSSGLGPRVTWLSSSSPRYQRDDVVEWLRRADA
jgi:hypothetical protein